MDTKPWDLRSILRDDLRMRYKRIAQVSWTGNDPKNIILRQHFAQAYMNIDHSKKTVLNIDETWVAMTDFRRMKWCRIGRPNSVPKKNVTPRISMITALDSNGLLYVTLVQANSNSSMMQLYFSHLIKLMNAKNANWRNDYIILLDNASYHTSEVMMEFFNKYQVPIIFTGPHSYSAAPIELFFAHFKRADINPRKLPTGKQ